MDYMLVIIFPSCIVFVGQQFLISRSSGNQTGQSSYLTARIPGGKNENDHMTPSANRFTNMVGGRNTFARAGHLNSVDFVWGSVLSLQVFQIGLSVLS